MGKEKKNTLGKESATSHAHVDSVFPLIVWALQALCNLSYTCTWATFQLSCISYRTEKKLLCFDLFYFLYESKAGPIIQYIMKWVITFLQNVNTYIEQVREEYCVDYKRY